jgi:hypothetical protein
MIRLVKFIDYINEQINFSKAYYHGTPTKYNYENIKKNGLIPRGFKEYTKKYIEHNNYSMMPSTYVLYLTKDIWQAARYSFISDDEEYNVFKEKEPYGYILEFSPEGFGKIYVDEDLLEHILRNIIIYPDGEYAQKYPFLINKINRFDVKKIKTNKELQGIVKNISNLLTEKQVEEILNNEDSREIVSRYKTLFPVHGYRIKNQMLNFLKQKKNINSIRKKILNRCFKLKNNKRKF